MSERTANPCDGYDARTRVQGGEVCWRRRGRTVESHTHKDPESRSLRVDLPTASRTASHA